MAQLILNKIHTTLLCCEHALRVLRFVMAYFRRAASNGKRSPHGTFFKIKSQNREKCKVTYVVVEI